jgi:hypothetical protein
MPARSAGRSLAHDRSEREIDIGVAAERVHVDGTHLR